jgi:WD40 repeat protein/tetratricopeptide (TPR) repeat protein
LLSAEFTVSGGPKKDEDGRMKDEEKQQDGSDSSFILQPSSLSSATARLPGQSEASTLSESGSQYWQSVARVGMQVADALAHAASQGILHRDIKPSNLLLDETGNVWVTDFGLAKADNDSENLTHTGDIIGTLRYMAPERFNGQGDVRSDVYSLGLTLYEMLALRTAFDASDRNKLVKQVMHDEPIRPRKLNPGVPRDLETVVLKAIARDPAHRYQTPAEVAEDLKRFVEDRPVRARRISNGEKLWRWCRRNPLPASLVAAIVLVFLLGFAGVSWQWHEAETAREEEKNQHNRAEAARQGAETARDEARQNANRAERSQKETEKALADVASQKAEVEKSLSRVQAAERLARAAEEAGRKLLYTTDMRLAPFVWRDDRTTAEQLRVLLAKHIPAGQAAKRPDLRGFEWHYYKHLLENSAAVFSGHGVAIASGAFTATGQVVTLDQNGQVRHWNLDTRDEIKVGRRDLPIGRDAQVRVLSPDGQLAALAVEKKVHVFSTATGKEHCRIDSETTTDRRLLFTSEGDRLVIVDGKIRWCKAATGQVIASLNQKFNRGSSLALSANGLTLAVVGHGTLGDQFSIFRMDPATQKVMPLAKDAGSGGTLSAAALSPDGRLIAIGKKLSGPITVFDTATGRVIAQHGSAHASAISAMTFSGDGFKLVTADVEGMIKIWEDARKLTSKVAPSRTLKGHEAAITHVAVATASKQLLSTSADKTARVWDLDHGRSAFRLLERAGNACYMARFSPDGQWIAVADGPGVRLWDASTGKLVRELSAGARGRVYSVAFSPTDHRLLAVGYGGQADDSRVELWDIDTGKEVARLVGATDLPDVRTKVEHAAAVGALAFSPDGKYLVAGFGTPNILSPASSPSPLKVWDVATRRLIRRLNGHMGYCVSLDFSRDGTRLASGSRDGTALIWTTGTWKLAQTLRNPDPGITMPQIERGMVDDVAFSPDGKILAMASREGSVLLWDVAGGKLLATLKGHSSAVSAVVFSPDGRTLATGGGDQTVRLWNVETRRELMQLDAGDIELGDVETLAFSPDGKHLLAGGRTNSAIWSTVPIIWSNSNRAGETLRRLRKSNADFPSRIRMLSENLRLHEALAKLDAKDLPIQAALAATRASWHAAQGRWAEAVREYDRLGKLRSGDAQLWLRTPGLIRVATALLHEGRPARAAALLTGGAKRRAEDGLPPVDEDELDDPENGEPCGPLLRAIETRLAKGPCDAGLLELRAELAGQWSDTKAQLADYTVAIDVLAGRPEAAADLKRLYGRRGIAFVRLEKWDQAVADFARVVTRETTDEELLTNQALALAGVLLRSPKYHSALKIADSWIRLAAAYRLVGDRQALDDLVKRRPLAAAGIGDLFAADGDWPRAAEIYSQGLSVKPNDPLLLSKRAHAHEALKQWQAAAADWVRATTGNPQEADLIADFARRLAAAGQVSLANSHFTKAQPLYERMLAADPNNDLVAMDLAQLLFDMHENAPNSPDREEKRSVTLKIADPWLKLGAAYFVNGRKDEASQYFTRAFQPPDGAEGKSLASQFAVPNGLSALLVGRLLDDGERTKLRSQTFALLKAGLDSSRKQLQSGNPEERAAVSEALLAWQTDSNLAGLRDAALSVRLSGDEQKAFTQLWADLTELLLKAIAAAPADRQVSVVARWLQERNPGFDGKMTHRIEADVVTSLKTPSILVQDLTPLRALTGLRTLVCRSTLGYDNKAESDAAVLRSLTKLESINGKPVAGFWKDALARQAEFKEWLARVSVLPAAERVKALTAKLKERNPGSPCHVTFKSDKDVETEIWIHEAYNLTDISPVQALVGLRSLQIDAGTGGQLSDLTPIQGMKQLTNISVGSMKVRDLSPLAGMKLTSLSLADCKEVRDLTPLGGMPLKSLNLHLCAGIDDLTPLKGMPLTFLNLHDGPRAVDLAPLRGMKLTELWLGRNRIRDLSPLGGMPLTMLALSHCSSIQDLSPLKGMPLISLFVDHTSVRDLTPLKDLPLKKLYIDAPGITDVRPLLGLRLEYICLTAGNITHGLDILRNMKSLKMIGTGHYRVWPAAEYWGRYEKGEFNK